MGGGSYDYEAHKALTTSRAALPREEVFRSRTLHAEMNPYGVKVRESRDSAAHPESIGIVFALDETGSMGDLPEMLAKSEECGMPRFMDLVNKFVRDPQVMFMAVGDARNREEAPLQVGQYESEGDLMDKWLTSVCLEGKGGGNEGESYDLALYFAARHTAMDCWEKRGKKGYLFITGDEPGFRSVSSRDVGSVCGDDIGRDIPLQKIVEEASRTFHVFFVVPDAQRRHYRGCEPFWREVLGDHVICAEEAVDVTAVCATIVALGEGGLSDLDDAVAQLKGAGYESTQTNRIIRAVEPFASTIGRAGTRRAAEDAEPPTGKGKSRNRRR